MAVYIVRPGDTLTSIAAAHRTTVPALLRSNPKITDPNRIYVNEVLALPPAQGPIVARPPVTHAPVTDAPNPIVARALAHAEATYECRPGTCDEVCAGYYGLPASGYDTAYLNALAIPHQYRHTGATIEAGMIGYWSGGSHHYGHAAPFMDAGVHVHSTDMNPAGTYAPGEVSTIPARAIHDSWGLVFMFASDPYFAGRLITIV